jgi:hypothetical protein
LGGWEESREEGRKLQGREEGRKEGRRMGEKEGRKKEGSDKDGRVGGKNKGRRREGNKEWKEGEREKGRKQGRTVTIARLQDEIRILDLEEVGMNHWSNSNILVYEEISDGETSTAPIR